MNVHISYKIRKTPDIDKELNHLLEKLQRRLHVFRPDLVHLKGMVSNNLPRKGTSVSLNLRLPTGQMAAQKSSPTAKIAVKAAFDDLLQQVTKHKDQLRNARSWERPRSGSRRPLRQVPFESTLAAVQPPRASADDIRSYVNAHLRRLELYVERELYFREAAGQLEADAVTKEEVVDEAIARALGADGDKPERLALEAWLYHLAIRAMNDLATDGDGEAGTSVHLEDSVRPRNVRASDEAELQFHQPDETLTSENVIADRRISTPEEIASSDEMIRLLQSALSSATHQDREAFILHVLEGFTMEEVATITSRPAEAVRASIAAARTKVGLLAPALRRAPGGVTQRTGIA